MDQIKIYIGFIARGIEVAGVLAIVVGITIGLVRYIFALQAVKTRSYKILRQHLGKAILLGLEILVAGDIISTVVTEPTMDKVLTLGLIVLIRTLLSFSLEIELEGKLPWKEAKSSNV